MLRYWSSVVLFSLFLSISAKAARSSLRVASSLISGMTSRPARSVLVCALLVRICSSLVAKAAVGVTKEAAELLVSRQLLRSKCSLPRHPSLIKVEPLQRKALTTTTTTFRFKIRKIFTTPF